MISMKGKMATSPYSEDLRKRVVDYLKRGKKQKECSEIFEVHINTISRWWCV
jgi:transposase